MLIVELVARSCTDLSPQSCCTSRHPAVSRGFVTSGALLGSMISPQSERERTVDAGENGCGRQTDSMSVSVCLRNPENSECGECQIKEFFFRKGNKTGPLWCGRTSFARARGDIGILPCVSYYYAYIRARAPPD